ncbi:MAG: hypothetical protein ACMUIL_07730 [bacterium]
MSLETKRGLLTALLLTALLLMSGKGLRHAGCYYSGFPNLQWNTTSLVSGLTTSTPLSFPFYNTDYAQSFGSFGVYPGFSGRYATGGVPHYGAFSYGGSSQPSFPKLTFSYGIPGNISAGGSFDYIGSIGGFGTIGSVGTFGSLASLSRPFFGYSLPYSGLLPGGSYKSPFAPYNPFNRAVSSDDPQPPSQNSLDPQAGDEDMARGAVYLRDTEIYILESYPMQVRLGLKGDLPTPCHELRARVSEPDGRNRIMVEVYSLVDPGLACIQVLDPFDVKVSLGSFTEGAYTVWVNGEKVEEFSF